MKVLILHQHFKIPQRGGAIRSYYLARALVDHGHEVVVLTGHTGKYYKENVEGIEVHWLPVPYHNAFGFLARGFSFLNYIWKVLRSASLYRDVGVCYAISVPLTVGIAAIRIKKKFGIPFIFEVGDLWPDAPVEMGFIKNGFLKKWLYRLEKRIYAEAQSIVGLSPAINERINKKAVAKAVHLIPNMSDTCFYILKPKNESIEKEFGIQNKFVVSYIGALGLANGLEYLLACAKESQRALLPVQFLICGEGASLPALKQTASEAGLNNVTFVPFQNRDGVRDIMNVSDAVFVCYAPAPILETGSPNKYFDGLAAGKLIIVNFGGWIREEIEQHQCGIYIDPQKSSDFVTSITPFLMNKPALQQCQQSARILAESRYSRKQLGDKFASIFNELGS